ncbi:phosphoribosylformylglycinamidine cyclo-ligase [Kineococcus gynurae]|uniref:Phosphoribosylformylglycinamidine cyclo-ligase n=1 Tax=Kineococcus gynurae TaxID=452979 RepID=A0ABV5LRS8_9ACTN
MSSSPSPVRSTTYADAGVDVVAGDRAVELMKASVARTHAAPALGGVVGGFGGFAGLYDVSALRDYRRPLLATSTDGVGTKVAVAQAVDKHDTIGFDLVGMVVDDIVVCGATPLFMTDYIACGRVVPERMAAIVDGIARACEEAGVALVGGETAEHPGLLGAEEYDVAGAVTGVVEADELLGAERVVAGDVLVAMASSGLHSNGYSLVRRVFADAGWSYDRHVEEFGRSLGEELLEPTRVYARPALGTLAVGGVHAMTHVTGGGLAANLARCLPETLTAVVDRATWTPGAVFSTVRDLGGVPAGDLERTLNLGVGMIAVVAPESADAVVASIERSGIPAWVCGEVRERQDADGASNGKSVAGGVALLRGTHQGW